MGLIEIKMPFESNVLLLYEIVMVMQFLPQSTSAARILNAHITTLMNRFCVGKHRIPHRKSHGIYLCSNLIPPPSPRKNMSSGWKIYKDSD